MKSFKFSKTYIAAFMYRFAFLLFVPFLQGLLFAHEGAQRLFTIYSADLMVAVFLLSVAVVRCKSGKVTVNEKEISVRRGAVFKTEEKSFVDFRGCVTATGGLFLRLFKGRRLRFFSGTAHTTAYLKSKDAKTFFGLLIKGGEKVHFYSGILRNLIMSLSFSNALTGLLAAVPVIRKASVLLGAHQTALILEGASLEGLLKFTGLPPVLSRVSSLLFLCWVVGFSTEFFREYGLRFSVFDSFFFVTKGLMTKTQAVFSKSSVKAVIFRQSLLMFLSGLYSGEVRLNIRPRRKIHIISAASRSMCADLEDTLFSQKGKILSVMTVPKSALWGYTYLPFLCLGISSMGLILFSENIIVKALLSIFTGIFAVWFFFRIIAFYRSSLSVWENFIEVKYFSGMNFTRALFKKEDITHIHLTQSIFQRFSGRCNLKFTIANTRAVRVKIKHLRLRTSEDLINNHINL